MTPERITLVEGASMKSMVRRRLLASTAAVAAAPALTGFSGRYRPWSGGRLRQSRLAAHRAGPADSGGYLAPRTKLLSAAVGQQQSGREICFAIGASNVDIPDDNGADTGRCRRRLGAGS